MTNLLISAASLDEAILVESSDANIIDLKNPLLGALGQLQLIEVKQIVNRVGGTKLISATVGDLPMQPKLLNEEVKHFLDTGVDIVKIGFFGNEFHEECIEALAPFCRDGFKLIGVLFADQQPNLNLVLKLSEVGFFGVMLDTQIKDGNSLVDVMCEADIRSFVESAKQQNLFVGLAGSLRKKHIEYLQKFNADYLGFRGAVCEMDNRNSTLRLDKINEIAGVLHNCNNLLV